MMSINGGRYGVGLKNKALHNSMVSTSNTTTYKWYPVCTQPRAEKKACQALLNKGIQAYLPLNRQLKQWSDRKKWVEEPFIKSYLFVYITEIEQTEVLMTNGIS